MLLLELLLLSKSLIAMYLISLSLLTTNRYLLTPDLTTHILAFLLLCGSSSSRVLRHLDLYFLSLIWKSRSHYPFGNDSHRVTVEYSIFGKCYIWLLRVSNQIQIFVG